MEEIKGLFKDTSDDKKVLIDVKGLYDISTLEKSGLSWWRL
jgi:UDP-N-acetyl-D-galactosamine dehydrogenase